MGWQSECGTHEGYLVGLVFDDAGSFLGPAGYPRDDSGKRSGRMRELSGAADHALRAGESRIHLTFVKVACACGWRSPLLRAAPGTDWIPSSVSAPEAFEDTCALLWQQHVNTSPEAHDGGYAPSTLLRRLPCAKCNHRYDEHESRPLRIASGCQVLACPCRAWKP